MDWPKDILTWCDGRFDYMSIPFTWLLPKARQRLEQRDAFATHWVVGGPAVRLMPDYMLGIRGVTIGKDMPGVLQRANPLATRTTVGCPRGCGFCGVSRIEPEFRELDDWPDLPVICDNNLLAASEAHVGRVMERLARHGFADFNQGLDSRLLTEEHARMIATISKPVVRLALDGDGQKYHWNQAVDYLLAAGIAKSRIRTYVLCGYFDTPEDAKHRCEVAESRGGKALPMWYHGLDELLWNRVTAEQQANGWTKRKRRELFCWYYQHRTLETRG